MIMINHSKHEFSSKLDYKEHLRIMKESFDKKWNQARPSAAGSLSDYEKIAVIGTGAFGTVKLYMHSKTNKYVAVKILSKRAVVKNKQAQNIINEKRVLQSIRFPFLVHLKFSYKDNDCLYLGLSFINGGEMFSYLRRLKKFTEFQSKFFAAQVCLALEYLHFMNLVYRDLKPENILLDHKGYLKLTDFGFCKLIKNGRTWTLCGTPEYIAPEIIKMKAYGKYVDWWAFGILLYEMVCGVSPFYSASDDPMVLFSKIHKCTYKMPSTLSQDLRHLIYNLLQVDITKRFGNMKNGADDIKNHNWFKSIDFFAILNKELEAPLIPNVTDLADTSNFDKLPEVRLPASRKIQYENEFRDF